MQHFYDLDEIEAQDMPGRKRKLIVGNDMMLVFVEREVRPSRTMPTMSNNSSFCSKEMRVSPLTERRVISRQVRWPIFPRVSGTNSIRKRQSGIWGFIPRCAKP